MEDPDFKEVICKQYDEFKDFKEGAYKTYTALAKETIDEFVDTITIDAFTGFVICKAIKDKLDFKAATEVAYSRWVSFFICKLQEMNLDAQGAFTVF